MPSKLIRLMCDDDFERYFSKEKALCISSMMVCWSCSSYFIVIHLLLMMSIAPLPLYGWSYMIVSCNWDLLALISILELTCMLGDWSIIFLCPLCGCVFIPDEHLLANYFACDGSWVLETYSMDISVLSPFPEYRSRGTGDFLWAEYRPRTDTWNMMGCLSTHQANPN